jgi:ribosomal protein S18 acetylase RimI-like enzyme
MGVEIYEATSGSDIALVKEIFLKYIRFIEDYLGQSIGFQNTDEEFKTFPDMYRALFIAKLDGLPVGACGVKAFKTDISELKRLYVLPEGRGHKIGERLTRKAIEFSKHAGFNQMYLDTDRGLTHANAIYEAFGFKDIDRYYENPMGCSRYMALSLRAP